MDVSVANRYTYAQIILRGVGTAQILDSNAATSLI